MYRFNSANGRAILFIIAGLVSWGIAETIWYVLANVLMTPDLFPSWADFFFLLGYPLFVAGIWQGYVTAGVKLRQVKKSVLVMVLSASFVLTALVLYFGVYQAYDPTADFITSAINIGYGLGDLVLVILSVLTILVAREYKGGKLASFWITIAAGFFFTLLADIIFAMYTNQVLNDVKPYTYVDLFWGAAYLVLLYGILENYIHFSTIQKNIKLKLLQRMSTNVNNPIGS
jgi:uncharacterized membrane protein